MDEKEKNEEIEEVFDLGVELPEEEILEEEA